MKFSKTLLATLTMAMASVSFSKEPITIVEQGIFTVGGSFVWHEGLLNLRILFRPTGSELMAISFM